MGGTHDKVDGGGAINQLSITSSSSSDSQGDLDELLKVVYLTIMNQKIIQI